MGIVVVGFVIYAGWGLQARWREQPVEVRWGYLLPSALPLAFGAVILAWAWKRLLEHMSGRRVATLPAIALNLASQVARYTPGKVAVPAIRMAGARQLGVPARVVAVSVFIEVGCFVAAGAIVSFGLLAMLRSGATELPPWLGPSALALAGASALGTLALIVVDRRRLPRQALSWLRVEGHGPLVPVSVPLVHLVYWLSWALHGYLISRGVGGAAAPSLAGCGLYALAPIVGFLALLTPGGLGVREAVLGVGLGALIGPAPAVAAAILSRLVSLVTDVAVWLGSRPLRLRTPQDSAAEEPDSP